MSQIIVGLSGGMDSTTLLARAVAQAGRANVCAVGVLYPSKHNSYEIAAARKVAEYYCVKFTFVDALGVFNLFASDLLKGGGDLPHGHYEAESMRRTVVPCRNLIFATIMAGLCDSMGGGQVWLGVHAGDHFIYPDCRPDTVSSLGEAVRRATEDRVRVDAPFIAVTKQDILSLGLAMKPSVPYYLTRTCYADSPMACGR